MDIDGLGEAIITKFDKNSNQSFVNIEFRTVTQNSNLHNVQSLAER
jgi:hypothetical protein